MSKFKVGDEVMLHKYSEYYSDSDPINPINTIGVITEIDVNYITPIVVGWSNGKDNFYSSKDLDMFRPAQTTLQRL